MTFSNTELVKKPWGSYSVIYAAPHRLVKILSVLPHAQLSLQSHQHRAERWTVMSGKAVVLLGGEEHHLTVGDTIFIEKEAEHRLINNCNETLQVLELSFGEIISEEDIIRHDDAYGR